jgi:hypothetical protein
MGENFVDRICKNYDCIDDSLDGSWSIFKKDTIRKSGKNGGDEVIVVALNEDAIKYYEAASIFFINRVNESIGYIPNFDELKRTFRWTIIYGELVSLGLRVDLTERYAYKGGIFSLPEFLLLYGGDNNNARVQNLANLLKSAVDAAYGQSINDNDFALEKVDECSYYLCRLTSSKNAEKIQIAIESINAGNKGRENNSIKWQAKAQELANEVWARNRCLDNKSVAKKIKPTLDSFYGKTDIKVPSYNRIRRLVIKPLK